MNTNIPNTSESNDILRAKIKLIKNNNEFSDIEKTKQIQELMYDSNKHIQSKKQLCSHYLSKKCSNMYFECCQTYYDCHRCHKENKPDCITPDVSVSSQQIVSSIECSNCKVEQPPSNKCINCDIQFDNYYCSICFIWKDVSITHCDKCKICRVGDSNDLFHCDNCDACFSTNSDHKCTKNKFSDQKCFICLDDVHSSQDSYYASKCGHACHSNCINTALSNGIYRCSICRKSYCDMTQYWDYLRYNIMLQPMPDCYQKMKIGDIVESQYGEFEIMQIDEDNDLFRGILLWQFKNNVFAVFSKKDLTKKINIYCSDCDIKSKAKYHFIGTECKHCNGFNTSIID